MCDTGRRGMKNVISSSQSMAAVVRDESGTIEHGQVEEHNHNHQEVIQEAHQPHDSCHPNKQRKYQTRNRQGEGKEACATELLYRLSTVMMKIRVPQGPRCVIRWRDALECNKPFFHSYCSLLLIIHHQPTPANYLS